VFEGLPTSWMPLKGEIVLDLHRESFDHSGREKSFRRKMAKRELVQVDELNGILGNTCWGAGGGGSLNMSSGSTQTSGYKFKVKSVCPGVNRKWFYPQEHTHFPSYNLLYHPFEYCSLFPLFLLLSLFSIFFSSSFFFQDVFQATSLSIWGDRWRGNHGNQQTANGRRGSRGTGRRHPPPPGLLLRQGVPSLAPQPQLGQPPQHGEDSPPIIMCCVARAPTQG